MTRTTLNALKSALHLSASISCSKLMHSGSVVVGVRSVIVTQCLEKVTVDVAASACSTRSTMDTAGQRSEGAE